MPGKGIHLSSSSPFCIFTSDFMVAGTVEGLILFPFFILESPSAELTTYLLCVLACYRQNALEIAIRSPKVRSLQALRLS